MENKALDEAKKAYLEVYGAYLATPEWEAKEVAWDALYETPEYKDYIKAGGTCEKLRRD